MAEPLKNSFGPEIPRMIGAMLETVASDFDTSGFVTDCLDGYAALELTDRARQIAMERNVRLASSFVPEVDMRSIPRLTAGQINLKDPYLIHPG